MAKIETKEKKYRILQGFNYKGKDGKAENSVRLSPGEDAPELDDAERKKLLDAGIICEIDLTTGENIISAGKDKFGYLELTESELLNFRPRRETILLLKKNNLSLRSLTELKDKIDESVLKYKITPNYYFEECQNLIKEQLAERRVIMSQREKKRGE